MRQALPRHANSTFVRILTQIHCPFRIWTQKQCLSKIFERKSSVRFEFRRKISARLGFGRKSDPLKGVWPGTVAVETGTRDISASHLVLRSKMDAHIQWYTTFYNRGREIHTKLIWATPALFSRHGQNLRLFHNLGVDTCFSHSVASPLKPCAHILQSSRPA